MAAPGLTDDAAAAALDSIRRAPENVVKPPKDIQSIVEKTAGYVSRNGTTFEDRIRAKESANPKFSFLNQNDAYHSYYLWRIEEIGNGFGTAVSAGRVGEATTAKEPEKPRGPDPPAEFHFSARMPNISAQDLEIVRLTALFAAKHGRQFITTLAQREAQNYQFDFLRPQHSLNQFFERTKSQYMDLLNVNGQDGGKAEQDRIVEVTKNLQDKFHLLERARGRAEYVKFQEKQKQEKQEEEEAEKLAYAQIDWHEFQVVETVVFTEQDDEEELAGPTSLGDLQSASLETKAAMSLAPTSHRIEEAMPTDESAYYNNYGQQQQQSQQAYPPQMPQYPPQQSTPVNLPPPPPAYPAGPSPAQANGYAPPPPPGMQMNPETDRLAGRDAIANAQASAQAAARSNAGAPPMKIRSDYVPRAQANRGRNNAAVTICPNCNQPIPYAEFEQHLRIEMLDPRWRDQKMKADSHLATSNLSTADVANNLKRLASQRTDVFDPVTGIAIDKEEEARRKRAALAYNGVPGQMQPMPVGSPAPTTDMQEQLRRIREKAQGGR
jgi:splicing factor 3A subunit 1